MQVNVDTVQSDQEVGEDVLLGLGDVGKEGGNEGSSVRELDISTARCKQMLLLTEALTGMSSLSALASTSPTSTPPSLPVSRALLVSQAQLTE